MAAAPRLLQKLVADVPVAAGSKEDYDAAARESLTMKKIALAVMTLLATATAAHAAAPEALRTLLANCPLPCC